MFTAIVVFAITVGVIVGVVVLVVALSEFVYFPEATQQGRVRLRKIKRIQPGMLKNDVLSILGNPQSRRDAKGRNEEWEYEIVDAVKGDSSNRVVLRFGDADGGMARVLSVDPKQHPGMRPSSATPCGMKKEIDETVT